MRFAALLLITLTVSVSPGSVRLGDGIYDSSGSQDSPVYVRFGGRIGPQQTVNWESGYDDAVLKNGFTYRTLNSSVSSGGLSPYWGKNDLIIEIGYSSYSGPAHVILDVTASGDYGYIYNEPVDLTGQNPATVTITINSKRSLIFQDRDLDKPISIGVSQAELAGGGVSLKLQLSSPDKVAFMSVRSLQLVTDSNALASESFEGGCEMDVSPAQTGWIFGSENGFREADCFSFSGGKLLQKTTWGTGFYSKENFCPDIKNSGFALEWRLNAKNIGWTDNHGYKGVAITLYLAGGRGTTFSVYNDRIVFDWDGSYPHSTYTFTPIIGEYGRFRLTVSPANVYKLYVDDALTATFNGQGNIVSQNILRFGTLLNDADAEQCIWDYIRYSTVGSFEPAPETGVAQSSAAFKERTDFNVLPSLCGWAFHSDTGKTEGSVFAVNEGMLTQSCGWGTAYYSKNNFNPTTANGFTLEWAFKAVDIGWNQDHGLFGNVVALGLAGQKKIIVGMYEDRVVIEWDGAYPHTVIRFEADIRNEHIFRLCAAGGKWQLYRDGDLLCELQGQGLTVTSSSLEFGILSNDADAENCRWDYIRYAEGIYNPCKNPGLEAKASDTFEYKTEMDYLLSSYGWTYSSSTGLSEGSAFSAANGVLMQNVESGTALYAKTDFSPDFFLGFTAEWKIKASKIGWSEDNGEKGVYIGLGAAGAKMLRIGVYTDRLVLEAFNSYPHAVYYYDSINSDIILRVAADNDGNFHIYKDGKYLGTFECEGSTINSGYLSLGSFYNDPDSEVCAWDFFRFTYSGAWSPSVQTFWQQPDVGPRSCEELYQMGPGLPFDLNRDCIVNMEDFAIFVKNWMVCNDPAKLGENGCARNW